MKYTDKLGLPIWNKPETDVFDIEQFNEGMQAIDDIIIKMVKQINGLVIGDTKVDLNEYVKEEVLKEYDKEIEEISSQLDTIAINVSLFGVVGDGVSDDTIAFRNAIKSTANNNKKLLIPRGINIYTENYVDLVDNTYIYSDGGIVSGMGFTTTSTENTRIRDIILDGIVFNTGENRNNLRYVDKLECKNLKFIDCNGMRVDYINGFKFENIYMSNNNYGISLFSSENGIINKITADNCPEIIDFYNCGYVVVDTVVATDVDRLYLEHDEVIDLGACYNITINNVHCVGHYSGIIVKNEQKNPKPVRGIKITNCTFSEICNSGIRFQFKKDSTHVTPYPNEDITIDNVKIQSDTVGSRGITIDNLSDDETSTFAKVLITNCNIDVEQYGITTQIKIPSKTLRGSVTIKNTDIKTKSNKPIALYNADNVLLDTLDINGNDYSYSLYSRDTKELKVINSNIKKGISPVYIEDTKNVSLINNVVKEGNKHGIVINYSDIYEMDKYINLKIKDNTINDYGKNEAYGSGINITNNSNKALSGISIVNNSLGDFSVENSKYGVSFANNNDLLYDKVIIKDNFSEKLTSFITNTSMNNCNTKVISDNI